MILTTAFFAVLLSAPAATANTNIIVEKESGVGIIKGIVRDEGGTPIADATVAIFRNGTSKLLKQVNSASDGSFIAKILPGTYMVLAVAQGFNPVTLLGVEVNRSAQLTYGFKLERSGAGNTLPEKRPDRFSSKWHIRAAAAQRSIYQHQDGATPVSDTGVTKDESIADSSDDTDSSNRLGQTVVETYFGGSKNGNFTGINFATMVPMGDSAEFVVIGQTGKGTAAPQRLQTEVKYRPNDKHQFRLSTALTRLGYVASPGSDKALGQIAFQASDEWKIKDGIILVYGFDYAKFVGAGNDFSLSPRLGFQYDIDSKTRFRAGFTTEKQEKTWTQAIDLEGTGILFNEPVSVEDLVVVSGKPQLNKSRRLEFGIERILDNRSSIDTTVFTDTAIGRGLGLTAFNPDGLGNEFQSFTGNQQGRAQGVRVVYSRRLDGVFSATAGYSFGSGQKLSSKAITDPANVFENDFFHSFFAQLAADMKTGTSIKTVFRLSPQATVFAIDPFKGRLAIYDPGLSVYITQNLPTLGLPFHAEAIVDARNLFDFQTGVSGESGSLKLNSQARMLRGGLLVRF